MKKIARSISSTLLMIAITLMLNWFNWLTEYTPWPAIGLIIIAILLALWSIKGNAIFKPDFYRSHREIEVHEIEVPEELQEKVFGKPKVEGRVLNIKSRIVKRKVKK
jgi:membrane protein YdbS with pleckstrin-like domain